MITNRGRLWRPIWLKILVALQLPIVSITDSAGSSDHAIVRGDCKSKEEWDKWKSDALRPLVPLGADDGALSAVRSPGCPAASAAMSVRSFSI